VLDQALGGAVALFMVSEGAEDVAVGQVVEIGIAEGSGCGGCSVLWYVVRVRVVGMSTA
jgi:positive regulator of sigma E activity